MLTALLTWNTRAFTASYAAGIGEASREMFEQRCAMHAFLTIVACTSASVSLATQTPTNQNRGAADASPTGFPRPFCH